MYVISVSVKGVFMENIKKSYLVNKSYRALCRLETVHANLLMTIVTLIGFIS